MKLHLPSGLRAALFACFAAFAGIGTTLSTATITGGVFAVALAGSVAQAADYTAIPEPDSNNPKLVCSSSDGTQTNIHSLTADDKLTFNGVSGWIDANNTTWAANILINPGAAADDGTVAAGWILADGSNRTYTLNGSISGTGDFLIASRAGSQHTIVLQGDISGYTGAITISSNNSGNRTLDIKNGTGTQREVNAKSITTATNRDYIVQIFGSNKVNSALDIKTLKIRNDSVTELTKGGSVANLIVDSAATLKLTADGALTLSSGTISGTLENYGTLTINGSVSGLVGSLNNGTVTFGADAMLTLNEASFTVGENGAYTLSLFAQGSTGTMSGLTVDKLDGIVTAGRSWSFDDTTGTISYTITSKDLSYAGGILSWNLGTDFEGGAFADNDVVTFAGDTEATVAAPISSAIVTVADGVTLTLTNGGVEANTLMTENLVVNGTLVLKDKNVLASEARVSADGTGTVVIDIASGANYEQGGTVLEDFTGTLDVQNGRYAFGTAKATPFASINVYSGGQLDLTTAYSGAITLEGHGTSTDAFRDTAMRMSANISGKVTIADTGSSIAIYNGENTLSGELAGSGDLRKTEGGRLILTGNISNTGTLDIQGGAVRIGSGTTASNTMAFSAINVGAGCALEFHHGGADFSDTDITLNSGAVLFMQDSNCGNTVPMANPEQKAVALGKLTLTGDASIKWEWKGAFSFTELTGAGNLSFSGPTHGNDPRATVISSMNNYKGTISGAPALHILYLGSVHQATGYTAIIKETGDVYLTDFSKTGAGNLVIVNDVVVSGILTMNYEGGLFTDEDMEASGLNIKSVADGTILSYTTAANLLSLSASAVGDSTLTLDLAQALMGGTPSTEVNLGIASEVMQSQLSVVNASGGELVQKDGTWWYTGGSFHTDWDINWGSTEVATAPSSVVSVADYSGTCALGNYTTPDSDPAVKPYRNDSTTSILITGTSADGGTVIGGESSDAASSGGGGNSGRTVTLDSWIKMTGGNLHLIVGGNYCNNWSGGGAVNFKGDSHILIDSATAGEDAAVVDYIIGGNYKDGKTPLFTGNSYISVKTNSLQGGIIGGSTCAHNAATTFHGDSNIYIYTPQTLSADSALIDLSVANGNVIVGGNAKLTNVGGGMTFDGNTNITLDFTGFSGTATMGKDIIGGSYTHNFSDEACTTITHTGDTNITIRNVGNTTFSKDIIGGSVMNAQTITQAGTANIDISGGTYTGSIIGGHYSTAGGATFSLGGVNVNLSGGTFQGDIYAAGYIGGASSTMTTGFTSLSIGSSVVLGSAEENGAIIVSGGYAGSGTGTVTGERTLNLAGTHANATFKDFDVVSVATGSDATAKFDLADGAISKTGAGKLTLGAGSTTGTVAVQEGTLALNGQTLTAVSVANGATLDGSVAGSNAGVLTLGANAGDIVNLQAGSGIAVSSFTLIEGTLLNVLDSMAGKETLTLFTGLSFDASDNYGIAFTQEDEVKVADLATYISNATAFTDAQLILTANGELIISKSTAFGAWNWNAPNGATWDNSWDAATDTEWLAGSGTSSDGNTVIFGDAGVLAAGSTTVTISGAVAPKRVEVNASAGDYVFVGAADGSGITGTADLVKEGTGKLTISLANSYSGGTIINGGTLEVTVAGALGTGDVALNGGTLVQSAAQSNKVVFGGGTLHYTVGGTIADTLLGSTAGHAVKVVVDANQTVEWTSGAGGIYLVDFYQDGLELSGDGTLKLVLNEYKHISSTDDTFAVAGNLVVESTVAQNNPSELRAKLTGDGTVTIKNGGHTIALMGDNSGFAGTLTFADGTVNLGSAAAAGGADTTLVLSNATVDRIQNGWTLAAKTVQVDGTNLLTGENAFTATLSGALTGSGTLKVRNDSTLVLTGSLAGFSGTLSDNGGAIAVDFNGTAPSGNMFADAGATLTGTSTAHYRVNYAAGTANLNAVVSGDNTMLTYTGAGTLVLTEDNTALGALTVQNGTVQVGTSSDSASWAGSVRVEANGTLHLVNQTTDKLVSAVTSTGTVILEAGNNLTSLSGGNLTAKGDVTLGSATAALGTVTVDSGATLTVNGNVTASALANSGTLKLHDAGNANSRHSLTLTGGTTAGGNIVANQVSIGGDSSFGSVDANNSFKANGHSVTFGGVTTILNGLDGVNNLTANAKVTVDNALSVAGALAGTGSLSVTGGKLTLGAASALDGDLSATGLELSNGLSVGGALSGITSLEVTTNPLAGLASATSPLVSAGSLTLGTGLSVSIAANLLSGSEVGTYTLIGSTAALDSAVTADILTLAVTGEGSKVVTADKTFMVGQITYSLDVDGNNIVLKGIIDDVAWDDDAGHIWSAESGVTNGFDETRLTAGMVLSFKGSDTVEIDGDVQADAVRIDASAPSADDPSVSVAGAYTFNGVVGEDSITTETLAIVQGDLTINGVAVSVGEAILGQSTGTDAGLVLGAGSVVAANAMTVYNTAGGEGLVVNAGATLNVMGALTADAAGVSVTVHGSETIGDTTIAAGVLGMGMNSSVAQIAGTQGGKVGRIDVIAGNAAIGSVEGTVEQLILINATSRLSVGSDITVDMLASKGTLELSSTDATTGAKSYHGLTITSKVANGGTVTVGSLDLSTAAGSSFMSVNIADGGALTLDLAAFTAVTRAASIDELLTADLNLSGALTLNLQSYDAVASQLTAYEGDSYTGLDGELRYTDYVLVDGAGLTAADLANITLTDADKLRQAFALAGTYACIELNADGDLVLRVHEDDPRYWNGGDSFTQDDDKWAGNPGNNGGEVLDLSKLDTYKALDTVDVVNVSKATLIDLTAVDPSTATTPADGLIIRNLTGTETLAVTGNGAAQDVVTFLNTEAAGSSMTGAVTLTGVTAKVDTAANAGQLTLDAVTLADDATLNVQTTGKLTTGAVTLSGTAAKLDNDGTLTTGDATLSGETASVENDGTLTTGKVTLSGVGATVQNSGTMTAGDVELTDANASLVNNATGKLTTGDVALSGTAASVDNAGTLTAGVVTLTGENASFASAGTATVEAVNGSVGSIAGNIEVTGTTGNYSGNYGTNAAMAIAAGAKQNLTVGGTRSSENLALSAGAGAQTTLTYTDGAAQMKSLNTNGADVTLANGGKNTLSVAEASAMTGGSLNYNIDALEIAAGNSVVVTEGIDLVGTAVNVNGGDIPAGVTFDVSQGTEGWELFTHAGADSLTADDVALSGEFFNRYFRNLSVENGVVKADLVTDYYTERLGLTENGTEGLKMLDAAALEVNPQTGDLAEVLKSLDGYVGTGDAQAADALASAVAGSGIAAISMALSGDMERQLKAIRNRTTTMGVDPMVVNEDMPYFNAWVNAEGDHRSLKVDSSMAGYTLTSWGGTVGFDMDVNPSLTWGLALTAMYADYSSESADMVDGDVHTYYVSAFARAMAGAWTHTFVATVGLSWVDVNRNISYGTGSYGTNGDTDGVSFGFLYEAARTFALNEDATACWQPVFNVAYRHTELGGYSESGSDAALNVGDQSLDTVTFGIGGRMQAVVGENIYNRTSIFEGRALVKFDAGDRESELETQLLGSSTSAAKVKSAEMDAFGFELGAGLTIPMGMDGGSIFMDGSVEFRGSYTSANATLGYRFNF